MGAEMTDQTEREALADLVCCLTHTNGGRCDNQHRLLHLNVADAILAAGFHRTPTPHVVTTVKELRGLDRNKVPALVMRNGTPILTWSAQLIADDEAAASILPATVLTPAPSPVDREAVVELIGPKIGLMLSGEFNTEGIIHAVLDAIENPS